MTKIKKRNKYREKSARKNAELQELKKCIYIIISQHYTKTELTLMSSVRKTSKYQNAVPTLVQKGNFFTKKHVNRRTLKPCNDNIIINYYNITHKKKKKKTLMFYNNLSKTRNFRIFSVRV